MTAKHPDPEYALEQIAATTRAVLRAVEAGDLAGAGLELSRRRAEIEALRAALAHTTLSPAQLEPLDDAIRHGAETARLLTARRETARACLAELTSSRLRLVAWTPVRSQTARALDLSA